MRPSAVADALAELRVTWLAVPIGFADTWSLAEEWTYRFLAAAVQCAADDAHALACLAELPEPVAPPMAEPTAAEAGHAALTWTSTVAGVSRRGPRGVPPRARQILPR